MTDLFLSVLNASFSAVWVVLAVVLARLVLKKGPRWLVCALWGLVALRLIFGGVEAPFSLIPSSQLIPPESLFDQAPAIHSGVSVLDEAVNPIYSESLRPMPGASINPLQVWLAVFAHVWVLGMAVMALWAAFSCHRVRRQVRESIPDGGVYLCDRIGSPFIFGLFRPKIYLPSGLDEDARDHVLAHERAHIARRDHWWKPLGFLILTVHWFNPALWLAYLLLCRDIELACDERVVKTLSAGDKKAYSSALLRCSLPRHAIAACPLAFGEVGVKARVKNVLNYKKPAFWVVLTAVVLSLVLAACLLTDPPKQMSELYVNGRLYTLTEEFASYLPSAEPIGTLRSILHDTTDHPTEELQATNLDESLAGCPLYPDGENIYLLKFDGSCLLFQPVVSEAPRTESFTWDDVTIQLDLPENWEAESFHGSGHYGFRFRDKDYKNGWITVKYWPDRVTLIDYAGIVEAQTFRSGATANVYYTDAEDAENGLWDMVWFVDDDACMSAERPENYLWDWDYYAQTMGVIGSIQVFDGGEAQFLPAPAAQGLGITLSVRDLTGQQLRLYYSQSGGPEGLKEIVTDPTNWSLERWEDGQWVTIRSLDMALNDHAYPVPMGGTTAWTMELFSIEPGRYRIGKTFNGYFHPGSNAPEGQPLVQTCYAEFEANPMGITLSLRNVTPGGATLVCTQDGSDWDSILTGAPWSLERLEEGQWVSVMPETATWTAIAYSVPTGQTTSWNINWNTICGELEPGTYRIGKRFTGTPVPPPILLEKRDQVEQLCYAEFTIE